MSTKGPLHYIPPSFSYILPVQSAATGVAIYAAVNKNGIPSTVFILVVVAAGIQFLFGLYCCIAGRRPRLFKQFIIYPFLSVMAGLWSPSLSFFARTLHGLLPRWTSLCSGGLGGTICDDLKDDVIWISAGLGCSGLNLILAIVMFILYVLLNIKNRRAATRPTSIPHHGTYAVPGAAPMQQPQQNYSSAYKPAFASAASPAPVGGVYGTPSPAPMYNAHASSARFSVHDGASSTVVSPIAPSPGPVEYGNMYRQYQTPQQQQPEYMYNRIAAAWRMAELQQPDGHWEWSGELATIVQQWGLQTLTADPEQVTSVTNACLTNMCQFIWTARREGRDSAVLSPAELARLASYNGDMSWAKAAMDRATSWLASQHP